MLKALYYYNNYTNTYTASAMPTAIYSTGSKPFTTSAYLAQRSSKLPSPLRKTRNGYCSPGSVAQRSLFKNMGGVLFLFR